MFAIVLAALLLTVTVCEALPTNATNLKSLTPRGYTIADCITSCSDAYGECLKKAKHLWENFYKNKKKIVQIANKCCMYHSRHEKAEVGDSFATCTKLRCGAVLFGLVNLKFIYIITQF